MPELPDVEVFRQYVDATSLRRRVDDVLVHDQLVVDTSPRTLRDRLRGAELSGTRRHGKHLFVHADGEGWLRLHFGMTGRLEAFSRDGQPEHTELRLDLDDGSHLAYVNQRKFGQISWVEDPDAFIHQHDLGPDPLADDVGPEVFRERVGGRRGTVKSALMNQQVLAGLGNVYVDEVLFHAGIHPESDVAALTAEHLLDLHRCTRAVIAESVRDRADVTRVPDDWLLPHREPGVRCPRGDGEIEQRKVSGRSTHLCPGHQRRIS